MSYNSSSVSSASGTINSTLTDSSIILLDESVSSLKNLLMIIFVLLFICVMMSLFANMCKQSPSYSSTRCVGDYESFDVLRNPPYNPPYTVQNNNNFINNTEALLPQNFEYNSFHQVPLTSPNTSDLVFGQLHRYITEDQVLFDISANLYVLDGNVFAQRPEPASQQSYKAYVSTENKQVIQLGSLKKDGDGIYKLKYVMDFDEKILTYTNVTIKYERDNESVDILVGKF